MSKINKILILLLATQLALIAYLYRPNQVTAPPTIHFFDKINVDQVVGLAITDNTKSITIEKKDNVWGLKTTPPYPADNDKVQALVTKLLNLTSSRLVARTKSSHARLKVTSETCNRKLTLTLNNGETSTLLLGTSPNYKTIHVRLSDDDNVYLVNDLAEWEVPVIPDDWWSNNYLDLEPSTLTRLVLKNSTGQLELTRDKKNNWQAVGTPKDKKLSDEDLSNFLNKACLIQLSSYLDQDKKSHNLDKPLVELELATGTDTIHLKIAATDAKNDEYIAKTSNSPFYVAVHGYEVKDLLETSLKDLLTDNKESGSTAK
ncbi:MAG: DUF4340 domain-containing protein [Desulfobulbaceae bacterium]|nr:DUF4340 domain-containing protein [Desulfobulbaceae bacterium]